MRIQTAQRFLAAIACVGMLVPQSALAEASHIDQVADVALRDGGLFVGKVVNAHGKPIADTEVTLRQAGVEVAATKTNQEGVFAAQGLRGGQYEVVADGGSVAYRLWAPETAPPAASTSALVVTGGEVINGNYGGGIMRFVREHPMLVAAGVATAIAVPIAVADDDDPTS